MNFSTRFKLLLVAILVFVALAAWPLMRRTMALNDCLSRGGTWNYLAHRCETDDTPHPAGGDSATASQAKPPIVPAH